MKKKIMILSLCTLGLFALVAFIFNSEVTKDPLALSPVVGKRISTPTGTLISCDLKALKDTVDIPLSYLTEELQIVKLDNRDEALIRGWVRTTVSDNYILVSNKKQTPYKLFTRDGKFVTTIGAYGEGPMICIRLASSFLSAAFFVALLLSIYFCPNIHLKLTKYMFV